MDELLDVFLDAYASIELKEEVARSFSLFDFFEYKPAYSILADVVINGDQQSDVTYDLFLKKLNACLDFVLQVHTLTLTNEATIYQKNEILTALGNLQKLEDYTGIIRTLESFEPNDEQLSSILSEQCQLDQGQIMALIENYNPSLLLKLKNYIYAIESDMIHVVPEGFDKPIKAFIACFEKSELVENSEFNYLGSTFYANGIILNMAFEHYLPFIEDNFNPVNEEETALHLLSVLLLSSDGQLSLLDTYRKYSFQLLQDLNKTSSVEIHFSKQLAHLNEYLKVQDEKARLS